MTEIGELLVLLRAEQRRRWQLSESVYVEAYLDKYPQLQSDSPAVLDLIGNEINLRRERGQVPSLEEYLQRFRELDAPLRQWFLSHPLEEGSFHTRIVSDLSIKRSAEKLFSTKQTERAVPEVSDYEVLSELGRGGMGVVYKARHNRLKRLVALKMIVAGAYASPDFQTRIRTEKIGTRNLPTCATRRSSTANWLPTRGPSLQAPSANPA